MPGGKGTRTQTARLRAAYLRLPILDPKHIIATASLKATPLHYACFRGGCAWPASNHGGYR